MRRRVALSAAAALLLGVSGCADYPRHDATPTVGMTPGLDVVSGLREDPALHRLLPADVRASGVIRAGLGAKGSPPVRYQRPDGSFTGVEGDLLAAVTRVLGVRAQITATPLETLLPGLASGKFDVGQSGLAATPQRERTAHFVTYYRDSFGFLVPARSHLRVDGLAALCGLRVATTVGTSFEALLRSQAGRCRTVGRAPYSVAVFSDSATGMLAMTQNKSDVYTLGGVYLRYLARQHPDLFRYAGSLYAEQVGFVFGRDSALPRAFLAATDELIRNGTYLRIMRKWGLASSALHRSELDPTSEQ